MSSHKKILKNEIFEKIYRYNQIIEEKSDIEGKNPDLTYPELFEKDDEYAGMCVKETDLQDEVGALLLETKEFPLIGLSGGEIKELGFFKRSADLMFEQNINKYLKDESNRLEEGMKKRLKKIKPLLLKSYISPHVYHMYRQAIKCFVMGVHEASCSMCRAVVEKMVGNFIKNSEYSKEVSGPHRHKKGMSYPEMLSNLGVNRKVVSNFNTIYNKTSKIIHGEELADDKLNYFLIKRLQQFIRKFPSPPK